MMRCMIFLLLIAFCGCSPSRQIAVAASEAGAHAASIRSSAATIVSTSTQADVVLLAQDIDDQAASIQASAVIIHRALPGVEDQTPWWASLLGWGFAAVIACAVVVLLWQTGIGTAIRLALGWIPRPKRMEASLAAATLSSENQETVREWIASKRASDPLFNAAWRAETETK